MARYRSVQVPSPYIEQLRAHDATLRQSLCDLDLAPTVVSPLACAIPPPGNSIVATPSLNSNTSPTCNGARGINASRRLYGLNMGLQ